MDPRLLGFAVPIVLVLILVACAAWHFGRRHGYGEASRDMRRLVSEHAGDVLRLQRAVRDAGLTMDEVVVALCRQSMLVQERRAADALSAPSPFPISAGPAMSAADCRVSDVGLGFPKGDVVSRGLSGKPVTVVVDPHDEPILTAAQYLAMGYDWRGPACWRCLGCGKEYAGPVRKPCCESAAKLHNPDRRDSAQQEAEAM